MPFNAGAIVGKAKLDTTSWQSGLKSLTKATAIGMAAVGVAVGVAMAKAIKAGDEFQRAMTNINTIVDETVVNTQELALSLLKLDPALGSTTELTRGMYQAFSAGAETAAEAMDITTTAAKFARAGLTDTFTAVDVLTTAINAYGKENMSAQQASDLLFNTIKRGKVTGEELASSLGKSIPLYASVGIGLDQLTAGMASMTKVGIKAQNSTTQLNAIVNAFIKPSTEMTEALERQGYASGAAFLEAEELSGALDLLQRETDGEADALGKLIPNVRGMKGVMALARGGAEEFNKVLQEQQDVVGITDEAFQEQEKTFETLRNSMKQTQIVVGNIGKHFVDKIAVGAIVAGEGIRNFLMGAEGMELFGKIAETTAGVFEYLRGVFKLLVDNILPPLKSLWDTLATSIADVMGETETGVGATKLLVGALKLVGVATTIFTKVIEINIRAIADFITLVKDSVTAVDLLTRVMGKEVTLADVREGFDKVGGSIKDLAVNYVTGTVDLVTSTVDAFKNFGTEVNNETIEIVTNVSSTSDRAKQYILNNWDEILSGQTDIVGKLKDMLSEVEDAYDDSGDNLTNTNKAFVWNLEATWKDYFDTVLSGMSGLVGGMGSLHQLTTDQEIEMLENQADSRIDNLQRSVDANIITEEEFAKSKAEMEAKNLAELNEAKKSAFDTNKKFNIADTIMTGASAIMGWWRAATQLGPIAGPIFGGAMSAATTAMTGLKVALIKKQQFVPSREKGGMASGLTRINEKGGELVVLPDKSIVVPHDLSRQIAGGKQAQNILHVSFEGANISDQMSLNRIVDQVSRKLGRELRSAS